MSARATDRREVRDTGYARPVGESGAMVAPAGWRASGWGPVLSGTAIAFVVFLIFSALWLAITASGVTAVGANLEWFQLASAVLAAAAGGAAAGWLDPRGAGSGAIQGFATWGLLLFVITIAGVATGTAVLTGVTGLTLEAGIQGTEVTGALEPFAAELWAVFAVVLGGGLIAALAGAGTGQAHRADAAAYGAAPSTYEPEERRRYDERDEASHERRRYDDRDEEGHERRRRYEDRDDEGYERRRYDDRDEDRRPEDREEGARVTMREEPTGRPADEREARPEEHDARPDRRR